jgi:CDP-diacylglycerol--serine O-phosphatidyltransferase
MDRKYFVGMPIPAAAGMVATTVHFCYGFPIPYWWLAALWIGLVGLLGFLMVSTWRFWSGKEINFSRRQPFQLLVLLAIVLFVLIRYSSGVLFFVALAYMFSGIWARAAYSWSRRRRQMPRGSGSDSEPLPPRTGWAPPGSGSGYVEHVPAAVVEDQAAAHPHAHEGEDTRDFRTDSRHDGY